MLLVNRFGGFTTRKFIRAKCYFSVTPNPKFGPFAPTRKKPFYSIKFGDGGQDRVDNYTVKNPNFVFGVYEGEERCGKWLEKNVLRDPSLGLKNVVQHGYQRSEWFELHSKRRNLARVMKKIIETSPTFNFSTNEGKNEAKKELLRLLSSAIDNEP